MLLLECVCFCYWNFYVVFVMKGVFCWSVCMVEVVLVIVSVYILGL